MKITRKQVLSNRKRVIEFLKKPARKKAKYTLDAGQGERCCIGHMCYALSDQVKRTKPKVRGLHSWLYGKGRELSVAPIELQQSLGLYSNVGNRLDGKHIVIGPYSRPSLTTMNDITWATPQEIGAYLEKVIQGGPDTPWKPLTEYSSK